MGLSLKLILFDIDSTLIDTGGAGARSWSWACERLFGQPTDISEYTTAGQTDPAIARTVFARAMDREPTEEDLRRLMATYLAVLPDYVAASEAYRVLPGVERLLGRLAQEGVLLGLTTGALEASAHAKLGRGRLNHFFLFGGYGSDAEDRVQLTRVGMERGERLLGASLAADEVAVVGDTPLDIAAARGAGALAIGVASGRYGVDELRAAEADHVLSSLAEPFPGAEDGPAAP